MTHLQTTRIALAIGAMAFIASCAKEPMVQKIKETNNEQKQSGDPDIDVNGSIMLGISTPASIDISAAWEAGATDRLDETALGAQTATVKVVNNIISSGRIGFQRWNQSGTQHFGRTNGAGDNGTAFYGFAFRPVNGSTSHWEAKVPFAFGTHSNSAEAIWTPFGPQVGISTVAMGILVKDNATGDENPTTGIIEVGDFRAIDGDLHESRPGKVIFRQLINGSWNQIGRTNGTGDDGDLLAFTTLRVRTDYTISGGKIASETHTVIPVAKIERSNNKLRLITDLPGQNIGTSMMLEY
jgi:hypothetical protein